MRKTQNLLDIAIAILAANGRIHGYELSKATGIAPPRVYARLHEFFDNDWLVDGWESDTEVAGQGRPPRRYYTLTSRGRDELLKLVASRPTLVPSQYRQGRHQLRPNPGVL